MHLTIERKWLTGITVSACWLKSPDWKCGAGGFFKIHLTDYSNLNLAAYSMTGIRWLTPCMISFFSRVLTAKISTFEHVLSRIVLACERLKVNNTGKRLQGAQYEIFFAELCNLPAPTVCYCLHNILQQSLKCELYWPQLRWFIY